MKKSPTETVKETVKGVDRAVSDKLVDGIEIGRMFSLSLSPSPCSIIPSLGCKHQLRHRAILAQRKNDADGYWM
jgi:hypothetical protein